MAQSLISRLTSASRAHGWWIVPQLIVVIALSVTIGLWGLWTGYAAFNSLLVWLYADHHGPTRNVRRQKMLKVLAIPMLPVGFVSVVATGGGPSIGDKAGGASPDESVRKAVSKTSFRAGMAP